MVAKRNSARSGRITGNTEVTRRNVRIANDPKKGLNYHQLMRRLLALLCFAPACCLAFAGTGSSVTKAYADSKGWVHIVTAEGREQAIHPKQWQGGGGYESVNVASDGKSVGWLADQLLTPLEGSTSYSYAVALELDISVGLAGIFQV